ncbi:MlaD family protein [Deferribacter thermophilus]|uniref:MlaD family protein n=1 Tax=Deferribacter thermophilus TaxID=53573 RepID=UPI003C277D0C
MAEKQFKNIEFKVGLFVFTAIILAIFIVVFLAIQKNVFTKMIRVVVLADSGDGLIKGMPVLYSGFQIAKVDDLVLRDDGKVEIKIKIPVRYAKWIKKDSIVKLSSKNFISSSVLVFESGKGEEIDNGYVFVLKRDKGVEELIAEVKPILKDAKVIVNNLKVISSQLVDIMPDIKRLSTGLGDLGDDLHNKKGSIGTLSRGDYLIDKIDTLTDNLQHISKKVDFILTKVENRVDETAKSIELTNKLLESSNKLVLNIDKKVDNTDKILNESSKLVRNLRLMSDNFSNYLDELDYLLLNTNMLLLNMQSRWPFNPPENSKSHQRIKLP